MTGTSPLSGPRKRPALPEFAPAWIAVSRGVSLFFGLFCLLTLWLEIRHSGFDANFLWLDLRPLPAVAARTFVGLAGSVLLIFAFNLPVPTTFRRAGILITMCLLSVGLGNAIQFSRLRRAGMIAAENDISFGWHLVASLVVVVAGMMMTQNGLRARFRDLALTNLAFVLNVFAVPAVLFYSYGRSDHSQTPANAVIAHDWLEHASETEGSRPSSQHLTTASGKLLEGSGRLILSGESTRGDLKPAVLSTTKLPPPRVAIDGAAQSDRHAVSRAAELCRRLKPDTISVTADFHSLLRLRTLYRQQGLDVATAPGQPASTAPNVSREVVAEIFRYWRCLLESAQA